MHMSRTALLLIARSYPLKRQPPPPRFQYSSFLAPSPIKRDLLVGSKPSSYILLIARFSLIVLSPNSEMEFPQWIDVIVSIVLTTIEIKKQMN